MAKNPQDDAEERAEREKLGAWFRAGNHPELATGTVERVEGPPYPKPRLEEVLAMPAETAEQLEAKKDAARVWIRQFCDRARFAQKVIDLHSTLLIKLDCAEKIDKVRKYLTEAEIDAALSGP